MSIKNIETIIELKEELMKIPATESGWNSVKAWSSKALPIVKEISSEDYNEFKDLVNKRPYFMYAIPNTTLEALTDWRDPVRDEDYTYENNQSAHERKNEIIGILDGIIKKLELRGSTASLVRTSECELNIVSSICKNFGYFAARMDDIASYKVSNESDVQKLLFHLLKIHFDDVKKEYSIKNLAGKGSRIDFLLKKEKIGIEAKYAGENNSAKKIGEEIISDIRRYSESSDIDELFFTIYDPNEIITNNDDLIELENHEGRLKIHIFVTN